MSMIRRLRPGLPPVLPAALPAMLLAAQLVPDPLHAAPPPQDRVVQISTADSAILAARARARAGLDRFFARLAAPGADDRGFSLKFDINHRNPARGPAEIVWAKQVVAEGGRIYGVLDNRPQTAGFTIGERIEIPYDAITDWAIRRGDRFEGHQSTRALMPLMSKREVAAVEARLWPE